MNKLPSVKYADNDSTFLYNSLLMGSYLVSEINYVPRIA